MNFIAISGNLARTPELKYTKNNIPVVNFTIAVRKDFGDGVDWVDCIAYRKTAELIAKHLVQGSKALFQGKLDVNTWEDKDKGYQKRVNVLVNLVEFLDNKAQNENIEHSKKNEEEQEHYKEKAPKNVVEDEEVYQEGNLPF